MKIQKTLLVILVLSFVIFVSGCTSMDPQALAAGNSMIKQFMAEHPNAKITATHFTAEQAKNIIDQIRSACDNPYIDEREFYRVTINDTETNFYAVVWIDWTNKTIECAYKFGGEGVVIEKPKTPANCTAHAYDKCYKNNLYWFDSCGNVQEKKEYCQYGCADGTSQSGESASKCLGECKSHAEIRCYGDNVYWFDSCGNVQEKKEYCNYGCENGFCNTVYPPTCEQAGGYCVWPQGYCGDGICSENERQQLCETGKGCTLSFLCPQDCNPPVYSASGGGVGSSATAATTGLIVTSETTATKTVVSYMCKPGYEASKYYCKEGGICCVPLQESFCGTSTYGVCSSDSDCIKDGCSDQVCRSVNEIQSPPVTTCELKDCYNAGKYGLSCKCSAGKCMWTKTGECTAEAKVCPDGTAVGRTGPNCEFAPCPTTTKYYNNAYWQCYDGLVSPPTTDTCKSYDAWRQQAEEFCKGRCTSVTLTATANTGVKCGVNNFSVWGECYPGIKPCAQEGEQFSLVYKDQYPEHCCSGLTEWQSGMDTSKVENGTCVQHPELVAGSPVGTCIKCGDGVCGKYETICNCPQDCQTQVCTENSMCIIYEGKSATITTSLGNYTVKMIGASTWTQAVISVNDITKQVTVGATYLISGANVFINGIFMSDSINHTSPLSTVELTLSTQNCTDSDGGKNYYNKGTVKASNLDLGYATDSCFIGDVPAENGDYLLEEYCTEGGAGGEFYKCPNGCSDGACIQ